MTTPEMTSNRIIYNAGSKSAEIYIYDIIGPSWAGMVDAKSFSETLASMSDVKQIDIRINSPGGDVFQAHAIYNALHRHQAKKIVYVDGIALSAASEIAMSGDEIHIAENALMMIHEGASSIENARAEDLRKHADLLDTVNRSIVKVYADRTGRTVEEIKDWMADETWMDASTAIEMGFATKVVPNKSIAARVDLKSFKNVPDWCRKALSNFEVKNEMTTSNTTEKPVEQVAEKPVEKTVENKVDINEVRAHAIEQERKRVSSINALCAKAKCPDLAERFINEGLSMDDVNRKLLERLIADNVPIGDGGNTAIENKKQDDPKAKYKAEYLEFKNMHDRLGVTEEMYVKSRELEESRK